MSDIPEENKTYIFGDTTEVYEADFTRRSKLLQHCKREHAGGELRDSLCLYGFGTFITLSMVTILLFGVFWSSKTLVITGLTVSTALGGALLLTVYTFYSKRFYSCWHRFTKEKLTLTETELIFQMTEKSLRSKQEPFVWVIPYASIIRIEYDRSSKRFKVTGRYNESSSKKPVMTDALPLPRGMLRRENDAARIDSDFYLEIPAYFKKTDEILQFLEIKTAIFIHPAMRGDDYADLRDLPGLKKQPVIFRPLLLSLVMSISISLILVFNISRNERLNPYSPYPPTEEAYLTGVFDVGESIVLDGCRITLSESTLSDNKLSLKITWNNENTDQRILLRLFGKSSNISASAKAADLSAATGFSVNPAEMLAPEKSDILLEKLGEYTCELVFILPENTELFRINISSDRWAPRTQFWMPEYKSTNSITFEVKISELTTDLAKTKPLP